LIDLINEHQKKKMLGNPKTVKSTVINATPKSIQGPNQPSLSFNTIQSSNNASLVNIKPMPVNPSLTHDATSQLGSYYDLTASKDLEVLKLNFHNLSLKLENHNLRLQVTLVYE